MKLRSDGAAVGREGLRNQVPGATRKTDTQQIKAGTAVLEDLGTRIPVAGLLLHNRVVIDRSI